MSWVTKPIEKVELQAWVEICCDRASFLANQGG